MRTLYCVVLWQKEDLERGREERQAETERQREKDRAHPIIVNPLLD